MFREDKSVMCDAYYKAHFENLFIKLQGWQIQSEEIDNELKSYSEHIRKAIKYFTQLDVTT